MDKTGDIRGPSIRTEIIFLVASLIVSLVCLFGFTPFAQAVNLPETGQTTCYLA